jgi:hypothetical protein
MDKEEKKKKGLARPAVASSPSFYKTQSCACVCLFFVIFFFFSLEG